VQRFRRAVAALELLAGAARASRESNGLSFRERQGMASGWKIITVTKRLGGGPPMKEYFLVAIEDRDEAVKALRERRQLLDVQITVAGQATDEYLEWLDVRPGEIFCVMAVS